MICNSNDLNASFSVFLSRKKKMTQKEICHVCFRSALWDFRLTSFLGFSVFMLLFFKIKNKSMTNFLKSHWISLSKKMSIQDQVLHTAAWQEPGTRLKSQTFAKPVLLLKFFMSKLLTFTITQIKWDHILSHSLREANKYTGQSQLVFIYFQLIDSLKWILILMFLLKSVFILWNIFLPKGSFQ